MSVEEHVERDEEERHFAHQIMFEAMVAHNVAIIGNQIWPTHQEPKDPIHFVEIEAGVVYYSRFFSGGEFNPALTFWLENRKFYIQSLAHELNLKNEITHVELDIYNPALLDKVFTASMRIFSVMQLDREPPFVVKHGSK